MTTIPPMRSFTLATLLAFGTSCIITRTAPDAGKPSQHASVKHGPSKPARPSKPAPGKKPAPKKPQQPKPAKPKPKPEPESRPAPRPETRPGPLPEPRPPAPEPETPPGAPKATHLVVPVRMAFADAVARIDSLIVKTLKQDWRTVSGPKDPTRVEVKYTVWRDPIEASFADRTLKVSVNVRYAADVRASARNPLGGGRIWITRGESWGTRSEPQEIRAKFHAELTIQDDFSVKARVELDDIDHGKAPSGDVCVKAIAKVCISKESIAPMVRKNLERQLVPQIEKALNDADRQIERALTLKPHAQKLWTALQRPQPLQRLGQTACPTEVGSLCSGPAWLVARPASLGISQPRLDGKDLRVDLALAGQFAVQLGAKPTAKPTPLPKLKPVTDPPGFAVRARLRVPLALLGDELHKQLKDTHIQAVKGGPDLVVTRVSLVHHRIDPALPRRFFVVVSVSGALEADLLLSGEPHWDARTRELSVKEFDYAVDTNNEALRKLSAENHAALRELLADRARWKLDGQAAALGEAVTSALDRVWRGHLDVDGALNQVHLESFTTEKDVLAADVVLAGQLAVALTP